MDLSVILLTKRRRGKNENSPRKWEGERVSYSLALNALLNYELVNCLEVYLIGYRLSDLLRDGELVRCAQESTGESGTDTEAKGEAMSSLCEICQQAVLYHQKIGAYL